MRKSLSSGRRRREATLQSHQAFLIRRKATRLRCASSLQFLTSSPPSSKPRPQAPSAATPAPPPTTANPLPAPVDVPVLDVSRPCSHTPRDLCVWFLLLNFLKIKKKKFQLYRKTEYCHGVSALLPVSPFISIKSQCLPLSYRGEQRPAPHGTAESPPDPGDGSHSPSPVLGCAGPMPVDSWGARAGVSVHAGGGPGRLASLERAPGCSSSGIFLWLLEGHVSRQGGTEEATNTRSTATGNRLCPPRELEVAGAGSSRLGRAGQGLVPPGGWWLGRWHVPSPHTHMPGRGRGKGGTWGIERGPWGLGLVGAGPGAGLAVGHERRVLGG